MWNSLNNKCFPLLKEFVFGVHAVFLNLEIHSSSDTRM